MKKQQAKANVCGVRSMTDAKWTTLKVGTFFVLKLSNRNLRKENEDDRIYYTKPWW